ncbi:hypothetical protein FNU79_15195 [Deinococcus detaillensis]|uniref:Uncharacterized protein n=1 Tax=Deinococcus detaillensis TaxID=2592048 RepID=A0A553UMM4_9DEIO|nr:hypothetical protein [Deinococcus detaillensis]TSA81472.1 hypothetical protein FNU79_15195 [Deinococcus detaillensis]
MQKKKTQHEMFCPKKGLLSRHSAPKLHTLQHVRSKGDIRSCRPARPTRLQETAELRRVHPHLPVGPQETQAGEAKTRASIAAVPGGRGTQPLFKAVGGGGQVQHDLLAQAGKAVLACAFFFGGLKFFDLDIGSEVKNSQG